VHESVIVDVLRRVMEILDPPPLPPETAETADWLSRRAGRQAGQQGKEKGVNSAPAQIPACVCI